MTDPSANLVDWLTLAAAGLTAIGGSAAGVIGVFDWWRRRGFDMVAMEGTLDVEAHRLEAKRYLVSIEGTWANTGERPVEISRSSSRLWIYKIKNPEVGKVLDSRVNPQETLKTRRKSSKQVPELLKRLCWGDNEIELVVETTAVGYLSDQLRQEHVAEPKKKSVTNHAVVLGPGTYYAKIQLDLVGRERSQHSSAPRAWVRSAVFQLPKADERPTDGGETVGATPPPQSSTPPTDPSRPARGSRRGEGPTGRNSAR